MQQLPADTYQLASAHRFGPPKEVEESISTWKCVSFSHSGIVSG